MPKTCEICGRQIKTGRKYCWEHRHTAQPNSMRKDRLDELNVLYLKSHVKSVRQNYRMDFIFFVASLVSLSVLFISLWGFQAFQLALPLSIGLTLLFIMLEINLKKRMAEEKVEEDINGKNTEYIQFVKDTVSRHRKEIEFRNSLLK